MSDYLLTLGVSLGLTLIAELCYALILKIRGKELLLIALMNVLTNPPVVLIAILIGKAFSPWHLLLEAAVVTLEGLILRQFAKRIARPFWLSLGLNSLSYGAGLIINYFV